MGLDQLDKDTLVRAILRMEGENQEFNRGFKEGLVFGKDPDLNEPETQEDEEDFNIFEPQEEVEEEDKDSSWTSKCRECGQEFNGEQIEEVDRLLDEHWEEEHEEDEEAEPAEGIDLEERYPLDVENIEDWSSKRLEYELVIFFKNRKDKGALITNEVIGGIFDEQLDTQIYPYKKVQQCMEKSNMLKCKDTNPKQYFLSPSEDKFEDPDGIL